MSKIGCCLRNRIIVSHCQRPRSLILLVEENVQRPADRFPKAKLRAVLADALQCGRIKSCLFDLHRARSLPSHSVRILSHNVSSFGAASASCFFRSTFEGFGDPNTFNTREPVPYLLASA